MTASVFWFICVREPYPVVVPTVAGQQTAFNRQAANAIGGLRNRRHAVGDLLPRPVSNPVQDHLLCDGSEISRVSFPQLFTEIGTEWGEGDGVTTFKLPNLVGTALPVPPEAPPQVIGEGGTVSDGSSPPPPPSGPGQVGGGGGGVNTGGRPETQQQN